MFDLSKRRKFLNDWTWTSKARCQALPVTNTFSQSSMSIPDSPLLSLVLIWQRQPSFSVWRNCFRFLECARTSILIDDHLFNPTNWNLGLHSHGVATSRTTSFNPRGNGHCQKSNGTIWKAIQCSLKSSQLPLTHWEDTLSDVLHSILSLLCTSTNCTLHERMFYHARQFINGTFILSWLKPVPIYVKRHVRNKDEPLVDDAELLEINPSYVHVRLKDGRETNVSIRDLSLRSVRDASPQVFPFPYSVMTIDILTTAVHLMKKTRKILFLQTIRLQTTKLSLQ